jgi:hypothetical protein
MCSFFSEIPPKFIHKVCGNKWNEFLKYGEPEATILFIIISLYCGKCWYKHEIHETEKKSIMLKY